MSQPRQKPKKSLRTLLILWFLLFSVVPLALITGYSLVKYEQAIDQELNQRLKANSREVGVIINDFESGLLNQSRQLISDHSLIFHMSKNSYAAARRLVRNRMRSHYSHRLWLHSHTGRLEVALYRDKDGKIQNRPTIEGGSIELKKEFLEKIKNQDELTLVDFRSQKDGDGQIVTQSVDLTVFMKIKNSKGKTVGYLEEVISLDEGFRSGLKKRLKLEVFFFEKDSDNVFSNHKDLQLYKSSFFRKYLDNGTSAYFDLVIQEVPFGFQIHPIYWGDTEFYIGLGASKEASRTVLKKINYAFFSVVGVIILLLIILSVFSSKIILRPLYELLEALRTMDLNKGQIEIRNSSNTEIGLLAESFNEMSQRVYQTQKDLRTKIKELEQANSKIKDTQAKLVHTAKMASLGQLVAGIAHELNNPIGFIYSNMSHLNDYSTKLVKAIEVAKKEPQKLSTQLEKIDFDYIVQDLPKLIRSCENGAHRTRDIVLGLRSFSRLEEAQIKKVDIRELIENTLQLLTGEFKSRIKVHKDLKEIPRINCYPSQLNQVFMNILSNAAQAIEGEGEIFIETGKVDEQTIFVLIQDTGKGMSKKTVEQIFDPFFTTKSLGKGTGLGLSISYGIVEKHGGEIQVKSQLGEGTQFKIIFPLKGPGQIQ